MSPILKRTTPGSSRDHRAPTELTAGQVAVAFAGVRALSGVSLSVRREEVVGLIGPNGAGKTTLVNALSGFAPVSEGSVQMDGTEVTTLSADRRARLGLARTFQHGRLFGGLSVRENVELGAIALGTSARTARSRAEALLRDLEIESLAEMATAELAHGDQQRVSVVRALAAEPAYLLLDEPAAGLPEASAEHLASVVAHARERFGTGVLVIDHNVDFVLQLADRVVVLDHGVVIAEGLPEEIRRNVDVVSAYLGESGVAKQETGVASSPAATPESSS
ncbi:MAG: ABC transporter ATP-binding protein [Acidimicrobiales bacterium]